MKRLLFLLIPVLSYGQDSTNPIGFLETQQPNWVVKKDSVTGEIYSIDLNEVTYTLNGVTLTQKRTVFGTGYWQWGTGQNVVVFLHGQGQRGNGTTEMEKVLSDGIFGRNGWQTYTWAYPQIFQRTDLTILSPQLPTSKGSWDIAYIDQFLDEVLQGRPFMLMGYSLGGGGALRYANQVAPKHVPTMVVGLASAISEKGTNIKIPYRLAHSTNDTVVKISNTTQQNTDLFVSGIQNYDPSRYERMTSGDHWGPLQLCGRMEIYDEFVSLAKPVVVPVEVEGKIVRIGSDIYAVFGNEKIKLN